MPILTREQILQAKLRTEELFIPEWGGSVFVRELSAQEMQQNGAFALDRKGNPDISRAVRLPTRLCLKQVLDEKGDRIFKDSDLAQIEQLHAAAVTRIADKVRTMSGMKTDAEKDTLSAWLEEYHPEVWEEYQDSQSGVALAKENFTETPIEN